jgi:hypothetical protein
MLMWIWHAGTLPDIVPRHHGGLPPQNKTCQLIDSEHETDDQQGERLEKPSPLTR